MSVALEELQRYLAGELDADREAEVEEILFADEATARRLDALVRLGEGVRELVRGGRLRSTLTVATLGELERVGLSLRTYRVQPGETVHCTIADEDLSVIRLAGEFGDGPVDVVLEGDLGASPPLAEHLEDVVVDRREGEIVLVYPGDAIRALPRSRFHYRVRSAGRDVVEYHLDHTPPA